ncbi:ABC transporter permease subunit [Stagnihabitans tardus]|uniref:ABC transporter permease subunit n=1 Tax=Stagnihabitans tardus TaxID=2699202 RepID=A0AAE4Y664_9RHOB|nr:ABC transporter permease subunit [Stagnihabitans tardus]NBZ86547.1 ABC transporter permease subunit [Stagnihabitans tardus]
MASGARAVSLAVAGLVAAPLAALALQSGLTLRAADGAALRFTVTQAALSALISCALAVPLARALMRRRFPGRGLLLTALGAPFLLPTVVAVLGIITVYGRSGWFSTAQGQPLPLYGLTGVLLANVFFNLSLATRILCQGWHRIPSEHLRLAASLNLPPWSRFRHVEAPMLRAFLPGALLAVFLICLNSFVIALTLGGGPGATTVELAIYQALRFDFDPGHAAALAMVQAGLASVAVLVAARFALPEPGAGLDLPAPPQRQGRLVDGLVIGAASVFLALPLAAVLIEGLPALASLPAQVWPAAGRSVATALASAALAVLAALPLSLAAARGSRWAELSAMWPMVASGLVLGTGWFLILRPLVRPEEVALPVTMLANALMALPFVTRMLLPEVRRLLLDYDRLARALGLRGLARLRYLTLPRLSRPLGLGAGIAAALSMGDLGTIALFADQTQATLPLVIQRLAGAYRMEAAAGAALVLVTLSFALFALFDLGGRHGAK